MGKSEKVDFSETIAACDLKVSRSSHLIEGMCVLKVKVISLPYIFQVLYVLCFTRPRYQVRNYRTIGPLVTMYGHDGHFGHVTSIISTNLHFHVPKSLHTKIWLKMAQWFLRKASFNFHM